jgi:hypothetical protein
MRFRIVQCLCGPARHAILAMAVNPASPILDAVALELLKAAVDAVLAGRGAELGLPAQVDPWCGLCGAAACDWTYDIGWSRVFPDWDVAQQALRQCEADQRASAALLDLLDATFNARLRGEVARHVDDAHLGRAV